MKAKIKTLIILIAICAVSLVSGICAGCIGEDDAKDRADKLGMTACVTYYANGGTFYEGNTPDKKVYRTDYYRPETPIFNIGVDENKGQKIDISRTGYVFAGWEYAVLDDNGLPLLYELDANGVRTGKQLAVLENGTASIIGSGTGKEILEAEKRFEAVPDGTKVFANGHPKVKDREHKYLVATWTEDITLEYRLITDAPIVDGDVTYNNGDVIYTRAFENSDTITLYPDTTPTTLAGASYIHLYWDAEGENAVKAGQQISRKEDENSVIYAKYLSGTWTAVKTANQAANMLRATGNSNYFVVNDIDCTGASFSYTTSGNFGGIIDGNGKTLSNINISSTIRTAPDKGSILANLTATAKVKNLTIENVTISLNVGINMEAYVLVSSVADGAVIENVEVNGVTFKITKSDSITIFNIQLVAGEYQKDNWLYGAYNTDAEFIEKYGNLVHNCTLIINNETIVTGGQL